jgi:hypothetical protein
MLQCGESAPSVVALARHLLAHAPTTAALTRSAAALVEQSAAAHVKRSVGQPVTIRAWPTISVA